MNIEWLGGWNLYRLWLWISPQVHYGTSVNVLTSEDKCKKIYGRVLTLIPSGFHLNLCWFRVGEFKNSYFIANLNILNLKVVVIPIFCANKPFYKMKLNIKCKIKQLLLQYFQILYFLLDQRKHTLQKRKIQ